MAAPGSIEPLLLAALAFGGIFLLCLLQWRLCRKRDVRGFEVAQRREVLR
jgi:hypothetical protein